VTYNRQMAGDYMMDEGDFGSTSGYSGSKEDFSDLSAAAGVSMAGAGAYYTQTQARAVTPAGPVHIDAPTPTAAGAFLLDDFSSVVAGKSSGLGVAVPIVGAVGLAAAGGAWGGIWGAAAGAAASGALVNLARYGAAAARGNVDPQQAHAHLVFAVVSAGVAVYTGGRAYSNRAKSSK